MSLCHLFKRSSRVILWGHCRLSYFQPRRFCCRHNGLAASNCSVLQLWLWIIRQDNDQSRPGIAGQGANTFVNDKVSRDCVLLIFLDRCPKRVSNPRTFSMSPFKTHMSDINKKSQFITLFTSWMSETWHALSQVQNRLWHPGGIKRLGGLEEFVCGAVNGLWYDSFIDQELNAVVHFFRFASVPIKW